LIIVVQIGAMEGMEGNPNADMMKLAFRGLGVLLIPMTAYFTKGVLVYWVANNTFSLLQGIGAYISLRKLRALYKSVG
jgi:membrane protein insertase Oxa1/YidC/SpoIIIJ